MKNLKKLKGLSRNEMKNITGGIAYVAGDCSGSCDVVVDGKTKSGTCKTVENLCYCSSGLGSC